jgi:alkaline phosphatase D
MAIDRRKVLGLLGVGAGASGCAATVPSAIIAGEEAGTVTFDHGIASGDPAETSVLLWTRVGTERPSLNLDWQVAEDEGFQRIVARGTTTTSAGRDHTVKVVAEGLKPGQDYVYRFVADSGQTSPVGRTRTLPAAASVAPVVLAVASCSLHPNGLFNAYDAIARLERLDAVVHLGDYIYEYGAGENDYGMANGRKLNRIPEPAHEILTLADYRARHAQYKTDPDLQAAHARAPWIVVFDDHETANDGYDGGAENNQEGEGDWSTRKAVALQAYFEWMPIREPQAGKGLAEATERSFRFGRAASLHMVETRLLARTKQLDYATDFYVLGADGKPTPDRDGFFAKLNDPERRLLGDRQLKWIERDAKAAVDAGCAWQLIGNQVVMARVKGPNIAAMVPAETIEAVISTLPPAIQERVRQIVALFGQDVPFNLDAWDGYPAERERLYAALKRAGARPVVLAGDSHTFWVDALKDASGAKAGVEFGTTGITSPSPAGFLGLPEAQLGQVVAAQNEEVEYVDFGPRGFIALTLTPETVRAELIGVSTIAAKPYTTSVVRRYEVRAEGKGQFGDLVQV